MLAIVIIIFCIIGLIEVPPLLKSDKKKELMIYMTLSAAAFMLSLLIALGVHIPSPAKFIENVIKSLGLI